MPMVKKSISITDQQDSWIKSQISTGHFGNESQPGILGAGTFKAHPRTGIGMPQNFLDGTNPLA